MQAAGALIGSRRYNLDNILFNVDTGLDAFFLEYNGCALRVGSGDEDWVFGCTT